MPKKKLQITDTNRKRVENLKKVTLEQHELCLRNSRSELSAEELETFDVQKSLDRQFEPCSRLFLCISKILCPRKPSASICPI